MVLASAGALVLSASILALPAGVAAAAAANRQPHRSFALRGAAPSPLAQTPRAFPRAVLRFVVDTNADTDVTPAALSAGKCADANGLCSLRASFEVASKRQEAVQVVLPKGVYELQNGELEDSDANGITLLGAGESDTIISAKDDSSPARVIDIGGELPAAGPAPASVPISGGMLEASNLTITGGDAPDTEANDYNPYGGGIALDGPTTTAVLSSVDITRNTADDEYGDAPVDGGGIFDDGSLWLIDSTLSDNIAGSTTSQYGYGGGLAIYEGSAAVEHSTIVGNTAFGGGVGIAVIKKEPVAAADNDPKLLFQFDAAGGGIVNFDGSLTLDGGSVSDNSVLGNDNADDSGAGQGCTEACKDPCDLYIDCADGPGAASLGGGGLWTDEQTLLQGTTLDSNVVAPSTAAVTDDVGYSSYGGAIFDGYGLSSIEDATLVANKAVSSPESTGAGYGTPEPTRPAQPVGMIDGLGDPGGGAVYDGSGVTIAHSVISRNLADEGDGGAVADEGDGTSLVDDVVDSNSATSADPCDSCLSGAGFGGGLYGDDAATIEGSSISGNTASAGGGALYLNDSTSITRSTISGNSANFGAGVLAGFDFEADDSTFADNRADYGGGAFFVVGFDALNQGIGVKEPVGIDPVKRKSVSSHGGVASAVVRTRPHAIPHSLARVNLSYDTIAGNIAPHGAGILDAGGDNAAGGGVVLASIVAGNTAPGGKVEVDCETTVLQGEAPSPIVTAGENVFGDSSCGVSATDVVDTPAHLTALGDHGGQTETMLPLQGSPALGNGGTFTCPASDQRGYLSPRRQPCDSGAVQLTTGFDLVGGDGGVFSFADSWEGSLPHLRIRPATRVVGLALTPDEQGYWLVTTAGHVYPFGDAGYYGDLSAAPSSPVVGIAATSDGGGYWLVTAAGQIDSFGDAGYLGSPRVSAPVVGISSDNLSDGYLLATSDGAVYGFGAMRADSRAAPRDSSANGRSGQSAVAGVAATPNGDGYWLVTRSGKVWAYGDARYEGSLGNAHGSTVVGLAPTANGRGYWLALSDGADASFGDAPALGSVQDLRLTEPISNAAS